MTHDECRILLSLHILQFKLHQFLDGKCEITHEELDLIDRIVEEYKRDKVPFLREG